MASKNDVVIQVIAETAKAIAGMAKFAVGIGAAALASKKLVAIGKDLLKAYGAQEDAQARLSGAIRATGRQEEINQGQIEKLASQLQSVTRYGDEVTISAAAMLQQLANLDQKGLEKVIPSMQDFAAAMGVDLNTAATLIGKTLGSSTNALSRYGIEIDATASTSEKLTQLTQAMNDKFAGTAELLANTSMGGMDQLKNAVGDLKEAGGKMIADFLDPAVRSLTDFATGLATSIASANAFREAFKAAGVGGATAETLAGLDPKRFEDFKRKISDAFDIEAIAGTDAEIATLVVNMARAQNISLELVTDTVVGMGIITEKALEAQSAYRQYGMQISNAKEQAEKEAVAFEKLNKLRDEEIAKQEKLAAADRRQVENLKLLADEFAKTKEGKIEFLEDLISRFEGWEIQTGDIIPVLRDLRAELENLTTPAESLAKAFEALPPAMVFADPVLIGLSKEYGIVLTNLDFAFVAVASAIDKAKTSVDNFKEPLGKMLKISLDTGTEELTAGIEDVTVAGTEWLAQLRQAPIDAATAKDAIDSLGSSLGSMISSGVLNSLEAFGEAMAQGGTGAESFKAGLDSLGMMLLNVLPQLLLTAGLKLVLVPGMEIVGVGLIVASGLVAIAGGYAKGGRNSAGTTAAALPDADTVAASRHGVTFGAGNAINPQITNYNIAGNALVSDQFGELIRTQSQAVYSGR